MSETCDKCCYIEHPAKKCLGGNMRSSGCPSCLIYQDVGGCDELKKYLKQFNKEIKFCSKCGRKIRD